MLSRDRAGNEISTFDGQHGSIKFLYTKPLGRIILRVLVRPWISKTAGWFLDRRISVLLIKGFIKKNNIDMSEYEEKQYRSYNEFFCRKIKTGKRPVAEDPDVLIAPCDGKLSVHNISPDSEFSIKGTEYTFESLVRCSELARAYDGGTLMIFRLTVDDYHRYCYVSDGVKGENVRIPGVFHTVNPLAAEERAIYKENTREYTIIETESFGRILAMEVGAMMVGRIVNLHGAASVTRGDEKGRFEFGGSTVILCFEKDKITADEDILLNSSEGFETIVRMGEKVGKSQRVRANAC